MESGRDVGFFLVILIIGIGIGICTAEENAGYVMYLQGGVSTLSEGSHGNMTLTIKDVIPFEVLEVCNRTIIEPMGTDSLYVLPLNAALVLNGKDGESVYLVKTVSWAYNADEKNLTLEIVPLEYYEGGKLTAFTEAKEDLAIEKVGDMLNTGMYFEIQQETPENWDKSLEECRKLCAHLSIQYYRRCLTCCQHGEDNCYGPY